MRIRPESALAAARGSRAERRSQANATCSEKNKWFLSPISRILNHGPNGYYDYKAFRGDDLFWVYGEPKLLTADEFGNYIAGFSGELWMAWPGRKAVHASGIAIDFNEAFWSAWLHAANPEIPYDPFTFDGRWGDEGDNSRYWIDRGADAARERKKQRRREEWKREYMIMNGMGQWVGDPYVECFVPDPKF